MNIIRQELCAAGLCQDCKDYEAKVAEVCDAATAYFKRRAPVSDNDLVVFDIDGTALDDRIKNYNPVTGCKRLEPVYQLYKLITSLRYRVVFLTGRDDGTKQYTLQNLINEGYTVMDELILRPIEIQHSLAAVGVWKDLMRCDLKRRYTLIACIGDQPMDTEGIHRGQYQIKLPLSPKHQQEECCIQ